jgi:hypothetical protein
MRRNVFFTVFGFVALVAWVTGERFGPKASASDGPGTAFLGFVNRGVDDAIKEISKRDRLRILDAARPGSQLAVRGPKGLLALSWSRETPDGLRWPLVILRQSTDPAGPPAMIDACTDAIIAYRITRMEWSADGMYLVVLTQSESLDAPGGMLAVLRPGTGAMYVVDRDVTCFTMSPDGRHLCFEKAKEPGNLTGPRLLVHNDGSAGQRKVLREVPFPTEQIASLGPVNAKTGRVRIALKDYSKGLNRPSEILAEVDLASGRFESR